MFNLEKLRWPYRDDTVFSLLSFIVFLVPLAFSLFTNENFETIKLVIWLVFFGWALVAWVIGKKRKAIRRPAEENRQAEILNLSDSPFLRVSIIHWLLGGIVFWALISAIAAPDKWYSFLGFFYRFTNSFGFLLLWGLTVVLLVDILDRDRWVFLIKILCVDAVLVALKSLLESFGLTLYQGMSTDVLLRSSPGFLGNPNFSAMFMASAVPWQVWLWRQAKSFGGRLYYALAVIAAVAALLILASRGALLGLAAGAAAAIVLLLLVPGPRLTPLKILAAVVIVCAAGGGLIKLSRPAAFNWTLSDPNVALRLDVWRQSWSGLLSHPVVGVGLGNFALFQERLPKPIGMGVFDDPHNLWIFLAVTGGAPLLLLFLALLGVVSLAAFRRLRRTGDGLMVASLSAAAVFMVAAAFTPVPIPCYLLLAVLVAGLSLALPEGALVPIKPPAKVLAGLCGAVFVIWGVTLVAGETALHYGYDNFNAGNYRRALDLLTLSKAADPANVLPYSFAIQAETELNMDSGRITADIAALRQLHPLQANTYVLVSNADFDLYIKLHRESYLEAAISAMSESLRINPAYPGRYGELGFYYYLKGDYARALENSERDLALDPTQLSPLLIEAKIYQQRHDRQSLMRVLAQAVKYHPDNQQVEFLWLIAQRDPNPDNIPLNIIYSNPS